MKTVFEKRECTQFQGNWFLCVDTKCRYYNPLNAHSRRHFIERTAAITGRTYTPVTRITGGGGGVIPRFDELATNSSALRMLLWWVTSILTFHLVYSTGVRGALGRNGLTFLFAVSFLVEKIMLGDSPLPHFHLVVNRLLNDCVAPEILPQRSETLPRGGPKAGE